MRILALLLPLFVINHVVFANEAKLVKCKTNMKVDVQNVFIFRTLELDRNEVPKKGEEFDQAVFAYTLTFDWNLAGNGTSLRPSEFKGFCFATERSNAISCNVRSHKLGGGFNLYLDGENAEIVDMTKDDFNQLEWDTLNIPAPVSFDCKQLESF